MHEGEKTVMTEPAPARVGARALAAVFLLALAVRAGLILRDPPRTLVGDALGYHQLAVSVADRGTYASPDGTVASRPPGYPLFLAAVYRALGPSPTAVAAVQALLGAAACALLAAAAACLLTPGWGLACGASAALYRGMAEPATVLLSEGFYGACVSAAFAALAWGRGWPWAAAAGAAFSAAALTRPEALPIAVLILGGGRFVRPDWGRKHVAAGLAALLLPVALWGARNAGALGRPLLGSSRGGISAYAGLQMPLERMGRPVEAFRQPAPGLGELAADEEYRAAFRRLWSATAPAERLRAYAYNIASVLYPFLPAYDATYVLLVPFWLAGLWAACTRPPWRPAAAFATLSLCAYTAFGGPASRYRDAAAPALVLLAALGASWARDKAGGRRALAAGTAWLLLNATLWAAGPHARGAALRLRALVWG